MLQYKNFNEAILDMVKNARRNTFKGSNGTPGKVNISRPSSREGPDDQSSPYDEFITDDESITDYESITDDESTSDSEEKHFGRPGTALNIMNLDSSPQQSVEDGSVEEQTHRPQTLLDSVQNSTTGLSDSIKEKEQKEQKEKAEAEQKANKQGLGTLLDSVQNSTTGLLESIKEKEKEQKEKAEKEQKEKSEKEKGLGGLLGSVQDHVTKLLASIKQKEDDKQKPEQTFIQLLDNIRGETQNLFTDIVRNRSNLPINAEIVKGYPISSLTPPPGEQSTVVAQPLDEHSNLIPYIQELIKAMQTLTSKIDSQKNNTSNPQTTQDLTNLENSANEIKNSLVSIQNALVSSSAPGSAASGSTPASGSGSGSASGSTHVPGSGSTPASGSASGSGSVVSPPGSTPASGSAPAHVPGSVVSSPGATPGSTPGSTPAPGSTPTAPALTPTPAAAPGSSVPTTDFKKQLEGMKKKLDLLEKVTDTKKVEEGTDGTIITTKKDGTIITTKNDGTITTTKKDGTTTTQDKDGTITTKDKDGNETITNPDGSVVSTIGKGSESNSEQKKSTEKKSSGDLEENIQKDSLAQFKSSELVFEESTKVRGDDGELKENPKLSVQKGYRLDKRKGEMVETKKPSA